MLNLNGRKKVGKLLKLVRLPYVKLLSLLAQIIKDFMIFSFASEDTIASVLLQKNDQGHKQPIAYFSRALQNSELKYPMFEKQAYALVKSLKHFRVFIGYSKVIVMFLILRLKMFYLK